MIDSIEIFVCLRKHFCPFTFLSCVCVEGGGGGGGGKWTKDYYHYSGQDQKYKTQRFWKQNLNTIRGFHDLIPVH